MTKPLHEILDEKFTSEWVQECKKIVEDAGYVVFSESELRQYCDRLLDRYSGSTYNRGAHGMEIG